jgi:hypothetical protein
LKEWTQGKGGFWKKLATTSRGMACHVGVARCKGCSQDSVVQGTQKGQMFKKRCWPKPDGISEIRIQDLKELRVGSRSSSGIYRKPFRLEFMKRVFGIPIVLWEVSDWTLWRGQSPPKWKERLHTE